MTQHSAQGEPLWRQSSFLADKTPPFGNLIEEPRNPVEHIAGINRYDLQDL